MALVLARWFRRPRLSDLRMLLVLFALTLLFGVAAMLLLASAAHAMPLSAGDRLQVVVEAGEEFSGRYQIDVQGRIQLPYAGPVRLSGLEPEAAAAAVSERLVSAGLFRRSFVRTTLLVTAWAPLEVRVSGAVFYPGAHRVNVPPSRDRAPDRGEELPGASLPERRLSDALRAAGGVTPWADVSHIVVRRNGQTRLYNLWGLVMGETGEDPGLQSGDEVLVASLPEAQPALARPSSITPPGIKIFMSNLIQPAQSNAQATVSGGQLSMAYGTRFGQAVVAGNCVGGIPGTSASRSAVLVRTDRITGRTTTWDSAVEDLIRDTSDARNPLLLEGDAVACYDSAITTVRDVFRTLSDVLNPFAIFRRVP
jgi:polysaccharide export outer membrane protein